MRPWISPLLSVIASVLVVVILGTTYPGGGGGDLLSGDIKLTKAATCGAGFSEYTAAQGRALVGMPSGGTIEGTVGTALTNLQDKTHTHTYTDVPNHVHSVDPPSTPASVTDPGHNHTWQGANSGTGGNTGAPRTDSNVNPGTSTNTTGITASVDVAAFNSANPTGGVATGTTNTAALSSFLSYVQLRACVKL